MSDIATRLRDAYEKVSYFPEKTASGIMDLLELRNLAPEAAARIEALEAALHRIMAAVEDEEWDEAPPHIHEIAGAALAPEQDK